VVRYSECVLGPSGHVMAGRFWTVEHAANSLVNILHREDG
jgi:hypothetical protein